MWAVTTYKCVETKKRCGWHSVNTLALAVRDNSVAAAAMPLPCVCGHCRGPHPEVAHRAAV